MRYWGITDGLKKLALLDIKMVGLDIEKQKARIFNFDL